MTMSEAVKLIVQYVTTHELRGSSVLRVSKHWYAGITNDPERRKREHENEKGIECRFFAYGNCGNEDVARKMEKLLEENGFSIDSKSLEAALDQSVLKEGAFSNKNPSKYIYVYKAIELKSGENAPKKPLVPLW